LGVEKLAATAASGGARFVILVTDGPPTASLGCVWEGPEAEPVPWEPLVEAVVSAFGERIRTFAVGSVGSAGTTEMLARVADRGGTSRCGGGLDESCYFDLTTNPDFGEALWGDILTLSGLDDTCTAPIPKPARPLDLSDVAVRVWRADGTLRQMIEDTEGDCDAGWRFDSDYANVEICPDTCAQIFDEPGNSIEIVFGCVEPG
jgi:hypothetical protein